MASVATNRRGPTIRPSSIARFTETGIIANDGTLEDATAGNIDFTTCTGLKTCLENWKVAYDNGYWYPGEGALTSTKDQTQAAFYQGKIATLFDAGSNAGAYASDCDFEVGVMSLLHPRFCHVGEWRNYRNFITSSLEIGHGS